MARPLLIRQQVRAANERSGTLVDMARRGHPVFDFIISALDPDPGSVVVDLGCGTGPALHALSDRDPSLDLVGLDLSAESIDTVRAELPGVRAEVADLNEPFALGDRSVDAVLSHNVLECLDDPLVIINEVARVLRPGGRAVFSHTDFDAIIVSGPDRMLTRRVLHAYADHTPRWTPNADGQMARQIPGLIRRSRLASIALAVHLTIGDDLSGDARARIDEIAASLRSGFAELSAEDVAEWRQQADQADERGEFVFCEPCFVVTAGAA